ncbi:MAG: rhodanese-like domain-containing protein [Nonlabens sp.]
MKDLNNHEFQQAIAADKNARIIDVRTDEEVAEGIIGDALHLDIHKSQEFMDEINKLDKDGNYYLYCRAGSRSSQACQVMAHMGFKNLHNLSTGFSQWDGEISHKK